MLPYLLQALVVIFSLLAGGFWAKSAAVSLPNMMENTTWAGTGAFPDALQKQARWNRLAAGSAALAAVFQALLFLFQNPIAP
jgi:hypothetical protein